MAHETEYYVIGIRSNRNNNEAHIREALDEKGLNTFLVKEINPSLLPADTLQPQEETPFEDALRRHLKNPKSFLHPILHALDEGQGTARISEISKRGKGVSKKSIDEALKILHGHVLISEEDPDVITFLLFAPKDGC